MALSFLLHGLFHAATGLACSAGLASPLPNDNPVPKPVNLPLVLAHLGETAEAARTSLPDFRCHETVISQQLDRSTVKRRVEFTADLRMKRISDSAFTEIVGVETVDGKPIDDNQPLEPPIYVEGGFTTALYYFLPEHLSCYTFTLSPGRVDFAAVPDAADNPSCSRERGLQGFATLDTAGEVTHVERRIPNQIAAKFGTPPFAAIDFAPVEMGGHTYRLSARMVSERPVGRERQLFEATYTHCRPLRPAAS